MRGTMCAHGRICAHVCLSMPGHAHLHACIHGPTTCHLEVIGLMVAQLMAFHRLLVSFGGIALLQCSSSSWSSDRWLHGPPFAFTWCIQALELYATAFLDLVAVSTGMHATVQRHAVIHHCHCMRSSIVPPKGAVFSQGEINSRLIP